MVLFNKVDKPIKIIFFFITLTLILGMLPAAPEEGMYPLSEIEKVDLVEAGLKINPKEIYNPEGISLVDALVNIGGCTGSFISEQGLIFTNHHCAFGAIARSSTVENNYLENGFHAKTLEEEIPASGYYCRITESYEDVSSIILDAVSNITDPAERTRIIAQKMDELARSAENDEESLTASVSEMFAGKSYILFKYRIIRDVRLVYAPPQSIGNFGGETDNWVWPRHTGDFSIMRAYVSPEGKAAYYSKDNVPFKPKKILKINPNGVEENDFVFMLGYPGRTFRHRPSQYLAYQQNYLLPYISDLYSYAISNLDEIGRDNKELQLSYASRVKGLANVMKNYRGKIKGLRKIDLLNQKIAEEKQLQDYINSDKKLKSAYGNLFKEIENVFENVNALAQADLWMRQIFNFSPSLSHANFILSYKEEMQKPEDQRNTSITSRLQQTLTSISASREIYQKVFEENMIRKMFKDALRFNENSQIRAMILFNIKDEKTIDNFINNIVFGSRILEKEYFDSLLNMSYDEIAHVKDPLFDFVKILIEQNKEINAQNEINEGRLNKLYGDLVDVKMEWKKTNFIPDANSTLRLTYGYIKGYSPADAVFMEPFTSIDGIIEKNTLGYDDFAIPDKLKTLYDKKDFGKYMSSKRNILPVGMLYNMDTTGGNSGSPILNAYGELVGINFDRAYEATINDFAWNESYSRSIGVDIRYVLWVLDKFSGAKNILNELNL